MTLASVGISSRQNAANFMRLLGCVADLLEYIMSGQAEQHIARQTLLRG